MTAGVPVRDEEIFAQALALPAAERDALLAAACGGDSARRADLSSMLAAHDAAAAGNFMAATVAPRRAAEGVGDCIGRYQLLEKIGEGGCGSVYRAAQREPVRREVALKVIKLGMDTAAVVARFEAERQALALMDHPAIATVFDAGTTANGRPFFAMELVAGVRITGYCDRHTLSVRDRLRLFIEVCRAVQHAHQKGVIHRDLKPSNILVAQRENGPAPKVIDFGVAKALPHLDGRLAEATQLTKLEQFIGTPSYMSPEQAAGTSQAVDTRTDVYALGVVLYELLTSLLPFEPVGASRSLDDLRSDVRGTEPPRPSARLRALESAAQALAASKRQTIPARLIAGLRGDLDWIVLKCLEKDPARRYDSAAALALDLERHLRDEPVTAAAPGTAYVLRKIVRRHRVAFATGGVIAFLLVGGLVLSTWLFLRERAMLERARYSEQKTVEAFRAALKQQAIANRERERARTPDVRALVAQPATRAEVLDALAELHAGRGDRAKADALRAEARELREK